jgi:hypothetical protein
MIERFIGSAQLHIGKGQGANCVNLVNPVNLSAELRSQLSKAFGKSKSILCFVTSI